MNENAPLENRQDAGRNQVRGRGGVRMAVAVAAALAAGFFGGTWNAGQQEAPAAYAAAPAPSRTNLAAVPGGGSFADLAQQVAPSVVSLRVSRKLKGVEFNGAFPFGPDSPFRDFFRQFEQRSGPRVQRGLGSGVIISKDGYILTNNHVVDDADEITVRLLDKRELKGKVVGRDSKTDLALVKVESKEPLPAAELGDSDETRVGDWVVAVGNPYGLNHTVTAGIVSAKGRALQGPYDDFIQTDASINPGNSGGPLLNLGGQVIGINAQIVAGGQGIGFAIPVNLAKEIAPQLKATGHVARGWLGVSIQDLSPDMASHFGLKEARGALVAEVVKDGPADHAGIQRGDVIVRYEGKPVGESHDLPILVAGTPVGRKARLSVLRDGKTRDFTVKIGHLEDSDESETASAGKDSREKLGLTIREITPDIARQLENEDRAGVLVAQVAPGSPAADAGLRPGDVIREVNRKTIKNPDEFARALDKGDSKSALLLVERGGQSVYMALQPGAEDQG
ncbi:MAG: DegQ family serine endoprotease [Myxococcota bacterium]